MAAQTAAADRGPPMNFRCIPRSGRRCGRRRVAGFTMIEVLITLVVLALGLIGVIGLQARGQQAELESYQRGQGLALLQDMVDRINTNRAGAHSLSYVTSSPVGGGGALVSCTGS